MTAEAYTRARATVALARAVALKGGQRSLLTFVAPWQPACDAPVRVYRAHTRMKALRSVEVEMHVPCRRCGRCLQFRQMGWRQRALCEIAQANRTWAVTLTFSPVQLAGVLMTAGDDELRSVERRAYADVQKWLDRVRKRASAFRYLAVFERGERTGRPHYHCLVHEVGNFPIPKRVLEATWPSHVHARLVDKETTGSASYITKYLTKDFAVRARASARYGKNQGGGLTPEKNSSSPPHTQKGASNYFDDTLFRPSG